MKEMVQPKVALILYGQPRFISTKLASRSQRRFLKNCNVSTFGHVWFSETDTKVETSSWNTIVKLRIDSDALSIIAAQWPGISLKAEEPREFEVREFQTESGVFKWNPKLPLGGNTRRNAINTVSQLYSINQALSLANAANEVRQFDYYVLTRYDCVINYFPNYKKWEIDKLLLTSHHEFPDPILIGTPAIVNATNAFPNWQEYARNSNFFTTPEELKKEEFLNCFDSNSYTNVRSRVEFLRSNSKPRAYFLLYIRMSPVNIFMRKVMGKVAYEFRRLNESMRQIRS